MTLTLSAGAIFFLGFSAGCIAGVVGIAIVAFVYNKNKK